MTYLRNSRRDFIKGVTATSLLSAASVPIIFTKVPERITTGSEQQGSAVAPVSRVKVTPALYDGPQSPLFETIPFEGNTTFPSLEPCLSAGMAGAAEHAPVGNGTAWGIPFQIPEKPICVKEDAFSLRIAPVMANWLVFLHTSDTIELKDKETGSYKVPFRGRGQLNEIVAEYIIEYVDGTRISVAMKERHQIGMYGQWWGENSIESVAHHKPFPVRAHHEQRAWGWGGSQTRVDARDRGEWINWIWAWENPYPLKEISGIVFEPKNITALVVSAISAGRVTSHPLRWLARKKAILRIPYGTRFHSDLDEDGLLAQLKLDMGQVISASPRLLYPQENWENSYNNRIPEVSADEVLIEYTAHPEARFHLEENQVIPVADFGEYSIGSRMRQVPPSVQKVRFRILEKGTLRPLAVKLHVHGESGEYLPR